jgi:type I restriction enzyme R subunit
MKPKEASARIKVNELLLQSGWRFFDDNNGKQNIQLETNVKWDDLGDDFQGRGNNGGFIDFLLLDSNDNPLVVIEAKRESIDPLSSAKDQAREYAHKMNARFIILTNGNLHYLWDTKFGNPELITKFPTQGSLEDFSLYTPNKQSLVNEIVGDDYLALSQNPNFKNDPDWIADNETRMKFIESNKLIFLRPYQFNAIKALQKSVSDNKSRFLFEMATGTGKTMTTAGVIKLFLRSGNARRVLFLVDRIELENQAKKAFDFVFKNDRTTVIYKNNKEDWRKADIVVSTVQTLLANDRYKKDFNPTDFELVISDEAHRSINGNARAVFEYFVGYKLGLTATPKDFMRNWENSTNDSKLFEARQLKDTYRTFGCDDGIPTYRYSLLNGVKDECLINPTLIDARTEITTEILSEQGYSVRKQIEGEDVDETFFGKDFERKFFNEETNIAICKSLLDNGLRDPISGEFGKTLIFTVSQKHATKIVQILNQLAHIEYPGKYNSDFAVQVTSQVFEAQTKTTLFSENTLNGKTKWLDGYDSSKTRICVTVGMMTTGYDCPDILNVALMRPVFSPADFVQMKGRGTRKATFKYKNWDTNEEKNIKKDKFFLFDFFANCEYFEEEYNYDEPLKLPSVKRLENGDFQIEEKGSISGDVELSKNRIIDLGESDTALTPIVQVPSTQGMRIDREMFRTALKEDLADNKILSELWMSGNIQGAEDFVKKEVFDKPKHFLNLEGIRKLFNVDRRVTLKEVIGMAFGDIETFKSSDESLNDEFEKFVEIQKSSSKPFEQKYYYPTKHFFKAYITDKEVQKAIDDKKYGSLDFTGSITMTEWEECNGYKELIPVYIKDYINTAVYTD